MWSVTGSGRVLGFNLRTGALRKLPASVMLFDLCFNKISLTAGWKMALRKQYEKQREFYNNPSAPVVAWTSTMTASSDGHMTDLKSKC